MPDAPASTTAPAIITATTSLLPPVYRSESYSRPTVHHSLVSRRDKSCTCIIIMTTLGSIGVYIGGGAVVMGAAFIAFGTAVSHRSVGIAPRCAGRPRDVIYNHQASKDSSQYRGSATFGWIRWTLGLTYETMLKGIPGTGTRNNGLTGKMLHVNLDDFVLLRFHGKFANEF